MLTAGPVFSFILYLKSSLKPARPLHPFLQSKTLPIYAARLDVFV